MNLELRVTVIEENGNQTISELERRVETLEEITIDHDTRISNTEVDVNGKCFSFEIFQNINNSSYQ